MAVTTRGRDNIRIAVKVLVIFIFGLAILLLMNLSGVIYPQRDPMSGLSPELSSGDRVLSGVYVIVSFLTFLLPLLVLRQELRKRRRR